MKANTEKLNMGKRFIPREALNRLGAVFLEGAVKYGPTNWKQGVFDLAYQEERLEHAYDHLCLWIEGDRTEDHLAKVMWFCATQLELERLGDLALQKEWSADLEEPEVVAVNEVPKIPEVEPEVVKPINITKDIIDKILNGFRNLGNVNS